MSSTALCDGTLPRDQLPAWLDCINSELHKTCSALFNPAGSEELKAERKACPQARNALLDANRSSG